MLKKLCFVLQVTGASHEKVCEAIEYTEFSDFEDCLQYECAEEISANYIVTRNVQDFRYSKVKAITPKELMDIWRSCRIL